MAGVVDMNGKPFTPRPAQSEPDRGQPNAEAVKVLEDYLDMARRGDITGVAVIASGREGSARYAFGGGVCSIATVGAAKIVADVMASTERKSHT